MNWRSEKVLMRCAAIVIALVFLWGYAKEKVQESYATAISKAADKAREATKKEYDQRITDLENDRKSVKDIPSAVRIETRYKFIPPAAEVTREQLPKQLDIPNSPGYTIRTSEGEQEVAKTVIAFEKCKADVDRCTKDKAQAETERDEWKSTAKGGSRFKRIMSATGKILIGAGVGYALGRAGR